MNNNLQDSKSEQITLHMSFSDEDLDSSSPAFSEANIFTSGLTGFRKRVFITKGIEPKTTLKVTEAEEDEKSNHSDYEEEEFEEVESDEFGTEDGVKRFATRLVVTRGISNNFMRLAKEVARSSTRLD